MFGIGRRPFRYPYRGGFGFGGFGLPFALGALTGAAFGPTFYRPYPYYQPYPYYPYY